MAGIRVLEGKGLSDGYITWFNGSPFVWPVIAALGHRLAGLDGARLMAALLSTVTVAAFAATAENLLGRSVALWCALALAVNGLFLALAHFAVYDVAALTGVALSMWCVTRSSATRGAMWLVGGAIAFAAGVIAKYGAMLVLVPLAGLVVSARGARRSVQALAVFLAIVAACLAAYFWLSFGSLFPASSSAYLDQTFGRSRGHIAALQVVFGLAPLSLASAGALVAWRRGQRLLVMTCLPALSLFPLFHLWTANFVSGQKHVVFGFLFGYLLAGVALQRLWAVGSRVCLVALLSVLTIWGALQCYWQDHSWSDARPLAHYLARNIRSGERVIAESSWSYILYLYPERLIASPADVIDANSPPHGDRVDLCQIPWVVGNPDSALLVRTAIAHCRHHRVLSSTTAQFYFDTSRLRLGVSPAVVGLYHLP